MTGSLEMSWLSAFLLARCKNQNSFCVLLEHSSLWEYNIIQSAKEESHGPKLVDNFLTMVKGIKENYSYSYSYIAITITYC